MIPWFLVVAGLVTLIVGADLLVRGSAWIAEAMGIRPLIVGLTVVAIGTSAPELVVSLIAAADGSPELVLGNVFGSNIANIALILGATALVSPIVVAGARLRFETMWLLGASTATFIPFFWGSAISHTLGLLMVVAILTFIITLVQRERWAKPERDPAHHQDRNPRAAAAHTLMVAAGLAGLIYGGDWLVDGARKIAAALGMSDDVIGITIVAIGTSLPELATALVAARRGHPELALGNIIGSNIFNILMVLGITSMVTQLPMTFAVYGTRTALAMGLTIAVAWLLLGRKRISRRTGGIFLVGYLAFLAVEVVGC